MAEKIVKKGQAAADCPVLGKGGFHGPTPWQHRGEGQSLIYFKNKTRRILRRMALTDLGERGILAEIEKRER